MRNTIALLSIIFTGLISCSSPEPLSTVEEVDLNRYTGVWYEIARLPISQEEGLKCVTASYAIEEDGDIQVVNRGFGPDGWEKAEGVAVQPDTSKPGQLRVSFFRPFYGDYYIIELDDEYKYVLVGAPSRKYLWILSRSEQLDSDIINRLSQIAESKGFDTSKFIFTEHDCPYEEE